MRSSNREISNFNRYVIEWRVIAAIDPNPVYTIQC